MEDYELRRRKEARKQYDELAKTIKTHKKLSSSYCCTIPIQYTYMNKKKRQV